MNNLRNLMLITLLVVGLNVSLNSGYVCAEEVTGRTGQISPAEDLMREHGVLRRIMLIYEKEILALDNDETPDYDVILRSAHIVQDFIENYHDKLEEDYVFPVFENEGNLSELTATLRQQHEAARGLTMDILRFSEAKWPGTKKDPHALANIMRDFIRVYRPHSDREDTVLFPALHELLSKEEYAALGDKFEDKEHELFGATGFADKMNEVAEMEKQLGIYDLSRFTPDE